MQMNCIYESKLLTWKKSCRALPYLKTEFLWIMISLQRSAECIEFESCKALWSSKEYGHQTLSSEYFWEIIYRFLEKK